MACTIDDIMYTALDGQYGLVAGTNLFKGKMRAEPQQAVFIHVSSGPPPEDIYGCIGLFNDLVTIYIRENTYEAGWDLANNVLNYLHLYNDTTEAYWRIAADQSVPLNESEYRDQKHVFSVRFTASRFE